MNQEQRLIPIKTCAECPYRVHVTGCKYRCKKTRRVLWSTRIPEVCPLPKGGEIKKLIDIADAMSKMCRTP